MTRAPVRDLIYRRRRFSPEVIETCVRWYLAYRLSYRDLVAMMAERDIRVSHSTILRWVLRYVPEYERRWGQHARPVQGSWRMDETFVPVRGGKHYLYRAVDKHGKSVDSMLCAHRDRAAAQAFFRQAVGRSESGWPDTINVDGHSATHLALKLLRREDPRWRSVSVRSNRYLNNIVEQDHRAIKRRCAAMLGLKSFRTAQVTLAGVELAHRIRKGQFLIGKGDGSGRSLKQMWNWALTPGQGALSQPTQPMVSAAVNAPELKRRRRRHVLTEDLLGRIRPLRYARKISDGRGLYLLVAPNGGKYWRHAYRFRGKQKTMALGVYPDVSLATARSHHQRARSVLAVGGDPMTARRGLDLEL